MASTAVLVLIAVSSLAQRPLDDPTQAPESSSASPIFNIRIPEGYRDWKLISVAHEEGNLNDIRAILGNDIAVNAYRKGTTTFPDGSIVARLAWNYVPSQENNKVFGRDQSFVAGEPTEGYLQLMVKDSRKYPDTGGWGFAQFDNDGRSTDETHVKTCFPCHRAGEAHDLVFTHYAGR